jgi:hypothetical protein
MISRGHLINSIAQKPSYIVKVSTAHYRIAVNNSFFKKLCSTLLIPLLFILFECSKDGGIEEVINPDCDSLVTLTFHNQTNEEQRFDLHYFCAEVLFSQEVISSNEKVTLKIRVNNIKDNSRGNPLLDNCDLTVLWQEDPISSPYQVIYPDYSCWAGDRYRTDVNDGDEYNFQIIDKPPCIELNKNFSLKMKNKLDTTVYLFVESGSVNFYSPTGSQNFNPKCWPNMCCQYSMEILAGEIYNLNEKITFFTIHSIGYEAQSWNSNDLINLFNPEEGQADSIVSVDIRGIVFDSLFVTSPD